jgi:DeoR family suf operon transcriptional repressor
MSAPTQFSTDAAPAAAQAGSFRGPRGALLLELKRSGSLGAKDLAGRLRLSLNAVRHHLKELEVEGVVGYDRVARGVGAPTYTYRLTALGEALFPRRYEATLTRILEKLAERDGREAAVAMLEEHYAELEARLRPALDAATTPAERVAIVTAALNADGYMAEGTATHCCGTLIAHNCAIRAVAERFPEICAAEQAFLGRAVGGRIERTAHMLEGTCACSYKVRFKAEEAP